MAVTAALSECSASFRACPTWSSSGGPARLDHLEDDGRGEIDQRRPQLPLPAGPDSPEGSKPVGQTSRRWMCWAWKSVTASFPLVDKTQDGELLRRIRGVSAGRNLPRCRFPGSPVHIRDNLELKPNAYPHSRSKVGAKSGGARLPAPVPGYQSGSRQPGQCPTSTPTTDPAFGLPAVDRGRRLGTRLRPYGLHGRRSLDRGGDPPSTI